MVNPRDQAGNAEGGEEDSHSETSVSPQNNLISEQTRIKHVHNYVSLQFHKLFCVYYMLKCFQKIQKPNHISKTFVFVSHSW